MLQKTFWICVLLLGWSVAAHAQVGVCPEGMIPNGDQYNPGNCVPDPSYNPAEQSQRPTAPAEVWADRWGAIATGTPGTPAAFGASTGMSNENDAKVAALAQCQATPNAVCKIHITYRNECVALVYGEKRWIPETGLTKQLATQKSWGQCKAFGNTQCIPYYSARSLPVRVQ